MRSRVVSASASLVLLLSVVLLVPARAEDLPRGIQRMHFPKDAFSPPDPQACLVTYYGGPVMSNVVVVQVSWGATVDSTVKNNLPTFYSDVVNSPYVDWLGEYNTNVASYMGATSNQAIGRGTFGGLYQIAPSVGATPPATVTNAQIQSELAAQITAGHLPAPTLDAGGLVNTLYITFRRASRSRGTRARRAFSSARITIRPRSTGRRFPTASFRTSGRARPAGTDAGRVRTSRTWNRSRRTSWSRP